MAVTHSALRSCLIAICFLGISLPAAVEATSVRVVALFPDKALVMINGQRKLLKVGGKTVSGVKLIKANSKQAIIVSNGIRKTYGLSRDMGEGISTPEAREARITRNNQGQYITQGSINSRTVEMLLDTGANVMAINANEARRLGINYKDGNPVRVSTASDTVKGFQVTLASVSVGGIRIPNVEATVLEGAYPKVVLLGMSYLRHVKFSEDNGVMLLQSRY
ncbi:MAG: retropepsin-like aspartic protease family protein [Endozoicomonas sp.]